MNVHMTALSILFSVTEYYTKYVPNNMENNNTLSLHTKQNQNVRQQSTYARSSTANHRLQPMTSQPVLFLVE